MSVSVRAVVFDLDGTLIDSMPMVLQAYARALEPYCGVLSPEEILARLGGPPERMFTAMLADRVQVKDALWRLRKTSLANWRQIQPFPGMTGLLAELRAAGCALAIWTGRERESAEWLLREHALEPYLQTVICGDDLPTHKPDPAGLAEVLRRLEVPAAAALFVGDADVDVLAGAAIGVRTLLIHNGRRPAAAIRAKAWRIAGTPAEAYAVVREELLPAAPERDAAGG